jgi:ParB-like chromosome segregation protein Spo0J
MTTRRIDEIVLGERHRRDLGDIASLADNVAQLGLLHPIVIRPDGTLIAGERRLLAAKQLGWCEIPVNVMDLDAVVRGEYAENAFRKDFTLSEAVAIKRALEPLEKAAAKARQGIRTDKHAGKLPTSSTGRAADKVAKATGMARRTLEKAEAIVDAADNENWDCHGDEAPGNDTVAPDQQHLVEGLKITADTQRHLDAPRNRKLAPEGVRLRPGRGGPP